MELFRIEKRILTSMGVWEDNEPDGKPIRASKQFQGLRDWLNLGLAAQVSAIPAAESPRSCGHALSP